MKTSRGKTLTRKLWSLTIISFFCFNGSFAQLEITQPSIIVTNSQLINFGAFCITGNSGGTITVAFDGSRTSTGSIVLLSNAPFATPAIYEIKMNQGRNISITYNPKSILTNSNGGKLLFDIGPSDKGINGSSFTTGIEDNFITELRIGGTLHIQGSAPPGNYSGSFDITFN
jgi:hypothetical protein